MNHYIGKVKVRVGEYETACTFRFKTKGNPDKYLEQIAKEWYGGKPTKDGESYYFDAGCVAVTPMYCQQISEDVFGAISHAMLPIATS